jgi:hypothetical protein
MAQWWICPADGQVVVDDASISDLDVSTTPPLPTNVHLVFWHGTHGEILYKQSSTASVRQKFLDVTPYVPVFNRWLTAAQNETPPITLAQAKAIKIDLVDSLYNMKRQATIMYISNPWDADDDSVAAMSLTISAMSGSTADATAITAANVSARVDALTESINGVISNFNAALTDAFQDFASTVVNNMKVPANSNFNYISGGFVDAINAGLVVGTAGTPPTFPSGDPPSGGDPGTPGTPSTWDALDHPSLNTMSDPVFSTPSMGSVSAGTGGSPGTTMVQWYITGSVIPTTLTLAQFCGLQQAIKDRRTGLHNQMQGHKNNINAQTTIAGVIAYNILAAW